ncbi:AraC family transcriptional regulator [Cohnella soli]|uniref:Helix-turn-helix domain-containing protein n=1 Tax=Cohnella soli TaxID=425005 RepID=A0ABW0I6A6_9BACL
MKPFRKPFALDPLFPFEIVHRDRKSSTSELPDHLHDLFELVYVHEGYGTFFIDNTFYEKRQGDLFLIPGNTIHRSFTDIEQPIVSTAVFFAPAFVRMDELGDGYVPFECFESARKNKQFKLDLPETFGRQFSSTLDEIAEELKNRRKGFRQSVRLHLQSLLLGLNRLVSAASDGNRDKSAGPKWLMDALREIDDNPGQSGWLNSLAAKACVSPHHFSRTFKKLTGMNVTDYVNAKRLVRAKELLRATDDNVESIAFACGFQSLPYFYRAFKSLTGMSPRAYRTEGSRSH